MRLGYEEAREITSVLSESFNEAEAHAPRIRPCTARASGSSTGFNEAEAHAPRILWTQTQRW